MSSSSNPLLERQTAIRFVHTVNEVLLDSKWSHSRYPAQCDGLA